MISKAGDCLALLDRAPLPAISSGSAGRAGSQPSEVGDGLQFVSARLAPVATPARVGQASAPTNPLPCQLQIAFDVWTSR